MRTGGLAVIVLAILLIFLSCQSRVLFERTDPLPRDGWNQTDLVMFSFPVEDTLNEYEISLLIRNEARYEYSNLFLFIGTTAPSGLSIRDTVEIKMADEKGKWYGKGIGGKYTLKIPYKTQVRFPQTGNFRIEIEQGMREEDLEFITDIGIIITKL